MIAASLIGTPAGVALLWWMDADHTRILIAAATALAALVLMAGWRIPRIPGTALTSCIGLAAGVLGGACAMPAPLSSHII